MPLSTQLWINHRDEEAPCAGRLKPVKNRGGDGGWAKPANRCALWTSTHGNGEGWLAWLRMEQWTPDGKPLDTLRYWLLDPDPQARIYEIDTYGDLVHLTDAHPQRDPLFDDICHPDWQAVAAAGWDGVHLTGEGQWATRLSHPYSLYGWDCESTLWFAYRLGNPREISYQDALAALPAEDEEEAVA